MSPLVLNFLMNAFICLLLIATISYCGVLSRRIRILQDSRSELAKLMEHFDASTRRASESITQLQAASKKIGEHMQARIDKAGFLADDLSLLIDRASKMAGKLEPQAHVPARPAETKLPVSPLVQPHITLPVLEESIEAMLERIGSQVKAGAGLPERPLAPARPKPRTPAEQELLRAFVKKNS